MTKDDKCRLRMNNLFQASDEAVWTDMDTLLLLEGLELFGDNWAEISDHVGTKSQVCACPASCAQCTTYKGP